jgi:hypothetical protein
MLFLESLDFLLLESIFPILQTGLARSSSSLSQSPSASLSSPLRKLAWRVLAFAAIPTAANDEEVWFAVDGAAVVVADVAEENGLLALELNREKVDEDEDDDDNDDVAADEDADEDAEEFEGADEVEDGQQCCDCGPASRSVAP